MFDYSKKMMKSIRNFNRDQASPTLFYVYQIERIFKETDPLYRDSNRRILVAKLDDRLKELNKDKDKRMLTIYGGPPNYETLLLGTKSKNAEKVAYFLNEIEKELSEEEKKILKQDQKLTQERRNRLWEISEELKESFPNWVMDNTIIIKNYDDFEDLTNSSFYNMFYGLGGSGVNEHIKGVFGSGVELIARALRSLLYLVVLPVLAIETILAPFQFISHKLFGISDVKVETFKNLAKLTTSETSEIDDTHQEKSKVKNIGTPQQPYSRSQTMLQFDKDKPESTNASESDLSRHRDSKPKIDSKQ